MTVDLEFGDDPPGAARSAPYHHENLLDRLSKPSTREVHYRHLARREQRLISRRLGLGGGDVLSVGSGLHPGRHLFPAPAFRLVAVDAEPACVAGILATGEADE